ncbi:hypothetical protein B0H16DRAFT_1235481, partial [Mycena metata]
QFCNRSHPQFETHAQIVRRTWYVPVILGPTFHRRDRSPEERELWARDVVILFKPWRTPSDLKEPGETWLSAALKLEADAHPWILRVIRNMNVLSECRDAR